MAGMAGSMARRLRAVELVIRVESMKDKAERDLDIGNIVEKARTIDAFTSSTLSFDPPKEQ